MNTNTTTGLTLIELIVVIAIIGVLVAIAVPNLKSARDSARVARTAQEAVSLQKAFRMFLIDTNQLPARCRVESGCDASTDPFLNALSVSGWNGPYVGGGMHDKTHSWGGHLGIEKTDYDSDGKQESFLIFDNDPPGAGGSNEGAIPAARIQEIDEEIDDGDLGTGQFRSTVSGVSTDSGSAVLILYDE